MQEFRLTSALDIENCLSSFGADVLFRGQTEHYISPQGNISVTSSQGRKGCVPLLLFKWTHYAKEILRLLSGPGAEIHSDLAQAILQHYGWRSFFVDLSSSYAISSWFASHTWTSNKCFVLAEDCFETPLLTVHEEATYLPSSGSGHLYVISRSILEKTSTGCLDLCTLIPTDFRARFNAQSAWLAGPLSSLPPSSIVAHITAPAPAFSHLAASHGAGTVQDLFPSRSEDIILQMLLKIPRRASDREPANSPIGIFSPDLIVPEYDFTFTKRSPPDLCFYEDFWIADDPPKSFEPLSKSLFIRIPEILLYCQKKIPSAELRLPITYNQLLSFGSIAIEASGIAKVLGPGEPSDYTKGLYLRLAEPRLVEVSELIVDHPGTEIAGIAINQGWFYRILEDGTWIREHREGQCPCNNDARHHRHAWSLLEVEILLNKRPHSPTSQRNISLLEENEEVNGKT